mmetsp:Transcript_54341/g.146538  ORF Transcript_54341/g.146538 Transcript_54341/m.146538 type:complete len:89 (-) Transcript_54341:1298-1564(-)
MEGLSFILAALTAPNTRSGRWARLSEKGSREVLSLRVSEGSTNRLLSGFRSVLEVVQAVSKHPEMQLPYASSTHQHQRWTANYQDCGG